MSKVMVSLPDELVKALDAEARRRSLSSSALIAAAARRELSPPAAIPRRLLRPIRRDRDGRR